MNLNHKNARLRAGQGEDSFIGLVGDIGGTNARFAIAYRRGHEARLEHNQTIECAGFSDFYQAVDVYLAGLPERPSLDFVALAMAGPVKNGAINLTNLPWTVTEAELKAKTGAKVARLMNDYAGLAFSLPHLTIDDTRLIGSLQRRGRSLCGHGRGHRFWRSGLGRRGLWSLLSIYRKRSRHLCSRG